jgi:hypothetical protein
VILGRKAKVFGDERDVKAIKIAAQTARISKNVWPPK